MGSKCVIQSLCSQPHTLCGYSRHDAEQYFKEHIQTSPVVLSDVREYSPEWKREAILRPRKDWDDAVPTSSRKHYDGTHNNYKYREWIWAARSFTTYDKEIDANNWRHRCLLQTTSSTTVFHVRIVLQWLNNVSECSQSSHNGERYIHSAERCIHILQRLNQNYKSWRVWNQIHQPTSLTNTKCFSQQGQVPHNQSNHPY